MHGPWFYIAPIIAQNIEPPTFVGASKVRHIHLALEEQLMVYLPDA